MAQNRPNSFEKANEKLTAGIYQECIQHGPESIFLCKSYFHLGHLFQLSRQIDNAKAIFKKIIETWKNNIIKNDFMSNENA